MTLIEQRLARFFDINPDCKRLAVWGRGEICNIVLSALSRCFPAACVIGVTDSFYTGKTTTLSDGVRLMSVDALLSEKPDAIIIASIRFEEDIKQLALNNPHASEVTLCSLSAAGGVNTTDAKSAVEVVFDWPEHDKAWERLASDTDDENAADIYQSVANLFKR